MLEGDALAAYAARQIFFEETRVEVMRDWRFRTRWAGLVGRPCTALNPSADRVRSASSRQNRAFRKQTFEGQFNPLAIFPLDRVRAVNTGKLP